MFKGYYRRNVHGHLCTLRDYIDFSEKLLVEEVDKVKSDNRTLLSRIDDEFYQDKFGELARSRERQIEVDFFSVHWSSVFITQYSCLESILDGICNFFAEKNGASLRLKDFQGAGIVRAKNYISKCIGVASPFGKNEWAKIRDYSIIRNKIVHAGLEIDERIKIDKKVLQIIEETPSISLEPFFMSDSCALGAETDHDCYSCLVDPRVELNRQFLGEVMNDFDVFLDDLFDELESLRVEGDV